MHIVHSLAVKVRPEGLDETLAFLDDEIDRSYAQEMQTARMMNDFSILGILLGCTGLFGLTSFAVRRRVREVGIRTSLGASVWDIVYRLSRESGLVLIAANLVAWPVGYVLLREWLSQFVYRIDLHPGYFALSGGAAGVVALITVALPAVPAAKANPVDSLRHE